MHPAREFAARQNPGPLPRRARRGLKSSLSGHVLRLLLAMPLVLNSLPLRALRALAPKARARGQSVFFLLSAPVQQAMHPAGGFALWQSLLPSLTPCSPWFKIFPLWIRSAPFTRYALSASLSSSASFAGSSESSSGREVNPSSGLLPALAPRAKALPAQ